MKKQTGFSLINVMLLLSAIAIIGVLQFRDKAIEGEFEKAVNAGKHLENLNSALNGYLVAHAPQLRKMQDNNCAGDDTGCVVSEIYCETKVDNPALVFLNDHQCAIPDSYERLIAEGFLPSGWQNLNPWGSKYFTVVTRVPKLYVNLDDPLPLREFDFELRAITVTTSPWLGDVGQPLLSLLGKAVGAGGADLAMTVDSPTMANGLNRRRVIMKTQPDGTVVPVSQIVSWNGTSAMNPFINGLGLLVARAGFESTNRGMNSSELLLRDGSNFMQAPLDMAGFRVNNVQDAHIGVVDRALGSSMPNWVLKGVYEVQRDGQQIPFPSCSASSELGGSYSDTFDVGEPRILVSMERLENVTSLGFSSERSEVANDPYKASERLGRAFGSYEFVATPDTAGGSWTVNLRYYQDVQQTNPATMNHNAKITPENSRGLASVYCYFDNKVESACNGQVGCRSNGVGGTGVSAPDLSSPPAVSATDMAPYQNPATGIGPGTRPPGAEDQVRNET